MSADPLVQQASQYGNWSASVQPDHRGGEFNFPVSAVAPEVRYLHLRARFVGVGIDGVEVLCERFDRLIVVRDTYRVP